ncbi:MAG: LPXTG cell wall anchor domain-containing protein [Clostridiales bacterium]|jgi:LPXTG-motif cell wall-anchored protein|nr:LPXTG cell wall anchor domain-containing protein [Clostridiales bacterium]
MKKVKKFLGALVVSVLLISVSGLTVYATDYAFPPFYPVADPSPGVSPSDVSNAVEAATAPAESVAAAEPAPVVPVPESAAVAPEGGAAPEAGVQAAGGAQIAAAEIESGAPIAISSSESVALPLDAIAVIANSPVPVTFEAGNYSISINPADITNGARAIDLHMDIRSETRQFGGIEAKAITVAPSTSGDYGFSLTVNIPAAQFQTAGIYVQNLKAYHIADSGRITRHPLTVNGDGSVSVKFSGASEYVITEEDLPVDEDLSAAAAAEGASGDGGEAAGGLTASVAPKTGDSQNPLLIAIIGLVALCAAVVMYRYIKKAEKSK